MILTPIILIKKGIEKVSVEVSSYPSSSEEATEKEIDTKEQRVNYMDLLKHIIPLICLLTIHHEESSFVEMFRLIQSTSGVYEILLDQTRSWWEGYVPDCA